MAGSSLERWFEGGETRTYHVVSLIQRIPSEGLTFRFVYPLVVNTMSRKFKIRDQEAVHFVTFTVIHWLDIFTPTQSHRFPGL